MVLKIGDFAPDFDFIDKNGNKNNLYNVSGKKLVFFFPKAFTPGCTKEVCSIQDNYQPIKDLGITEIFGISLDSKEKQEQFAKKYNIDYIFVSDYDTRISKSYGVYRNKILFKFSDRDTFIINSKNEIVNIFRNGLLGRKSKLGLDKHGIEIIEVLATININR